MAELGGGGAAAPLGYAYNDGDGSTAYDVEYPIQLSGMDPVFHTANLNFQPLPFASMKDRHFLLNGRSYPDTLNPNEICTADANNAESLLPADE